MLRSSSLDSKFHNIYGLNVQQKYRLGKTREIESRDLRGICLSVSTSSSDTLEMKTAQGKKNVNNKGRKIENQKGKP